LNKERELARFLIIYNSGLSADELMATSTAEEMKASMEEWMAWAEEAKKSSGFEFGMPLKAVNKVTNDGVAESESHASGYSIMEGDTKEAIATLLTSHPHLKRSGSSIDVLEMLPMPGM
jgi:hypothetical protein